jgi:hypothetical protein
VLALVEDRALRAVQVLRRVLGAHRPGAEADDATAPVAERKGDARAEAVIDPPRLVDRALHEPGLEQLLLAEAAAPRGEQDAIERARRVADAEASQHRLLEAAPGEVVARLGGLLRLPEVALVVAAGPLEQRLESRLVGAARRRARVLLGQLERHVVALGQHLERTGKVEALRLHRKRERVARGLAAEAVVHLLRRRDVERRRALVVERAEAVVGVGAGAAQLDARADQVDHVDRVADPLLAVVGVARHLRPLRCRTPAEPSAPRTRGCSSGPSSRRCSR